MLEKKKYLRKVLKSEVKHFYLVSINSLDWFSRLLEYISTFVQPSYSVEPNFTFESHLKNYFLNMAFLNLPK